MNANLAGGWNWALSAMGLPPLQLLFLLSLRVAAVFLMTPVLYAIPMPGMVRMMFVLCISFAIAMGLAGSYAAPELDFAGLLMAALQEVVLGATLALGIILAFAAFDMAGRLLDIQIGFGMAQVFDPVSRKHVPILTSMMSMFAVLFFFLVNGHHALLRGIAYSVERFPVGAPWALDNVLLPVIKQVSGLFSLGFALAAPIVFCLFLIEITLGLIARNLPQLNMFSLGIPLKIVVGLLALAMWFSGIGSVMTRVYASIYKYWDTIYTMPSIDLDSQATSKDKVLYGR
jgi:flagellar biosynthesis protein FliR